MSKPRSRKQTLKTDKRGGKALATIGTLMGFAVSVGANIGDEFVKTEHPSPGAMFFGFFWPFVLLFGTEILARIDWPKHWFWSALRIVGFTPVVLTAGWISYWHLVNLMQHYGEDSFGAHIAPFAIDGFMLVSSVALLAPSAVAKAVARAPKAEPVVETTEPVAPAAGPDVSDLIPLGEAVLALLAEEGRRPSQAALAAGLRERGTPISKARARALYGALVSA